MAAEHEVLVNSIDEQVNKILSEGGDEIALLTSFADRMNNDVWKVMRERGLKSNGTKTYAKGLRRHLGDGLMI